MTPLYEPHWCNRSNFSLLHSLYSWYLLIVLQFCINYYLDWEHTWNCTKLVPGPKCLSSSDSASHKQHFIYQHVQGLKPGQQWHLVSWCHIKLFTSYSLGQPSPSGSGWGKVYRHQSVGKNHPTLKAMWKWEYSLLCKIIREEVLS